jgi:cytochrome c oxidase subunit IV
MKETGSGGPTPDHAPSHVVPRRVYYTVFATLIGMTLLTIAAASVDMGPLNTVVALAIACFKASLVLLYFMHLRQSPRLVWIAVATGIAWLLILILITLSDYMSRGWLLPPGA